MRTLVAALVGVFLGLISIAPASPGSPLIGIWSSTLDWGNQQAGLYSVLTIQATDTCAFT